MNAGHFCRNLLFRMNLNSWTSCHSWHVSWIFFHPSFVPLFADIHDIFKTAFNKTFCICHRNGDAKAEKLLTLFVWQVRKLGTICQPRLNEEPWSKAPYTYSCLRLMASATSLGFSRSYLYHIFSFHPFPSPKSPLVCCRSHLQRPETNAASPMQHHHHQQQLNQLCFCPTQRHQFTPIFVWQ